MQHKIITTIAFATLAAVLISTGIGAGEKKVDKVKPKPADPIVVMNELINADLKDKVISNSFCKTYTFKMEKDKAYQIELQSNNFRPYLRLENSKGAQVGADFDRFGNQSAVLMHRPNVTEDYTIVVTSLNANAQGKFTMTVKELTGDEGKPIALKLVKGAVKHEGNIERTDIKYEGKIAKSYTVKFEKGSTYQIDHMAKFDAYLYLIGPDGRVLAQDDDGGDGLNSRIIHKADATGDYRVIATSLGGSNIGAYTFQIRQTGGDPPKEEKK